jgi:hypothetical protein
MTFPNRSLVSALGWQAGIRFRHHPQDDAHELSSNRGIARTCFRAQALQNHFSRVRSFISLRLYRWGPGTNASKNG